MSASSGADGQLDPTHSGLTPPWYSDPVNVLLAVVWSLIPVYVAWLYFEWGSERTVTLVGELGFLPLMALGVLLAWRVARRTDIAAPTRRAWMVIGAALLLWLTGDTIWAYYEITSGEFPFPSWADLAYLAAVPALLTGILLFPAAPFSRSERIKFWLDSGIIVAALTALIGYIIVSPGYLEYSEGAFEIGVLLAYPATDILILLAAFSILVRRPAAGTAGVLAMLAFGLFAVAAADLWWTFLEAQGSYERQWLIYTFWIISQALVVTSPQRHFDILNRGLPVSQPGFYIERTRMVIPYVAAGLALLVLTIMGVPALADRLGVVFVLLLVLIGLVVARQVIILRENTLLQAERIVQESEERFEALVQYSSDMMTVLERDLTCRYQSPAVALITGHDATEFHGSRFIDWLHPEDRNTAEQTLNGIITGDLGTTRVEWRIVAADGRIIHLETIISNELDNPSVGAIVLNSRDVSERKQFEAELTHQAYHDALTGLPNRTSFLNTLVRELRSSKPGQEVALLFIDLDHFKPVNDTLGHEAGDELLKQVAGRLRFSLREQDTLGRFAGDEFTVVMPGIGSRDDVLAIAIRIGDVMDQPFTVAGTIVSISSSIGVAVADSPQTDPRVFVHQADAAMYAAKRNGRNRAELFEPWMADEMRELEEQRAKEHYSSSTTRISGTRDLPNT